MATESWTPRSIENDGENRGFSSDEKGEVVFFDPPKLGERVFDAAVRLFAKALQRSIRVATKIGRPTDR
ncbi:MAG: hypothetical protein JO164_11580 [Candidatus Eremiobacteraeota bacterium]|nr:hypothetical protein [Candidatus Eremiobacteraeota bacterium]